MTTSPLGKPTVRIYLSTCAPGQLVTFYSNTLGTQGWTGSFNTPTTSALANNAQSTGTSTSSSGVSGTATPRVGNFIGMGANGATVLFVELGSATSLGTAAASSATSASTSTSTSSTSATPSGTGGSSPTYVEVIEQQLPMATSGAGSASASTTAATSELSTSSTMSTGLSSSSGVTASTTASSSTSATTSTSGA